MSEINQNMWDNYALARKDKLKRKQEIAVYES
jgi:hypothetical protein